MIVPVDVREHAASRLELAVICANPADTLPETAIAAFAVPAVVTEMASALVPATKPEMPVTEIEPPFAREPITVDPVPVVVTEDPAWAVQSVEAMRFATAGDRIASRAPSVFAPERHASIAAPVAPVIDMSFVVPVPMCWHAMIEQPTLLPAVIVGTGVAFPELCVAMMPAAETPVGVGQSNVPRVKHPKDGVRNARPPVRPTPMSVPLK